MEDDDVWLYGDPNSEEKKSEGKKGDKYEGMPPPSEDMRGLSFTHTDDDDTNTETPETNTLEKEAGELSPGEVLDPNEENHNESEDLANQTQAGETTMEGEEEDGEEGEGGSEDDDSDDDVQVTIGEFKSLPPYSYGSTPVNLNIKRVAGFGGPTGVSSGSKSKGIDLDTVGNINGLNIYEFNLDSLEDKPWRKPGADITDYFNYGFNEDTWKIYCERQRKLRVDNNVSVKPAHGSVVGPLKEGQIPTTTVNENSKYSVPGAGVKKAGPPPGRKMSGSIDVIGGGTPSLPSRRPLTNTKENVIQVIGHIPPGVPPPHLAPTHLPPPNFMGPPPDPTGMNIPTTGSLPPTNIPPPIPGASFQEFPSSRYGSVPPYDDHFFNGQGSGHGSSQYDPESTQHSWSSSSPRNRDRDRSRDGERFWEHGTREYERERRERDEERRRHHRGDYHRERSRERYEKSGHEKGYEKGYEKEYERDYEREKRHKEHRREREEEKHRSSRRRHHHESDEEHRSSRHKHKRSKRERGDDEPSSSAAEMSAADGPSVSGTPPTSSREEGSNSTPSRQDNAD